ncbi:hypothetical protein HDU79_006490 [Rhizoclosmatium sp. JEL0117]|nr:hypothetical protein HDU79_006490 [Rhizoclosmatium sp. JEL0117]
MKNQSRIHLTIVLIVFVVVVLLHVIQTTPTKPIWLVATMSHYSPKAKRRRLMIRETYQRLTNPLSSIATTRFILGEPPTPSHLESLIQENNTYGDIIILPIPENPHTANTIKPITFLSSLLTTNTHLRHPFISKADDDSYIHLSLYYKTYIHPNTHLKNVIIGRNCTDCQPYLYATGQLYTLSLEMSDTLASLFSKTPLQNHPEDALVGKLLEKHNLHPPHSYTFIRVENREAFDFDARHNETWKKNHAVRGGAINPHKLKRDVDFLGVAALFDEKGVVEDRVDKVDQVKWRWNVF